MQHLCSAFMDALAALLGSLAISSAFYAGQQPYQWHGEANGSLFSCATGTATTLT